MLQYFRWCSPGGVLHLLQMVPKRDRMTYEKIADLFSEDNNRQKLREYMKCSRLPVIPYLGVIPLHGVLNLRDWKGQNTDLSIENLYSQLSTDWMFYRKPIIVSLALPSPRPGTLFLCLSTGQGQAQVHAQTSLLATHCTRAGAWFTQQNRKNWGEMSDLWYLVWTFRQTLD